MYLAVILVSTSYSTHGDEITARDCNVIANDIAAENVTINNYCANSIEPAITAQNISMESARRYANESLAGDISYVQPFVNVNDIYQYILVRKELGTDSEDLIYYEDEEGHSESYIYNECSLYVLKGLKSHFEIQRCFSPDGDYGLIDIDNDGRKEVFSYDFLRTGAGTDVHPYWLLLLETATGTLYSVPIEVWLGELADNNIAKISDKYPDHVRQWLTGKLIELRVLPNEASPDNHPNLTGATMSDVVTDWIRSNGRSFVSGYLKNVGYPGDIFPREFSDANGWSKLDTSENTFYYAPRYGGCFTFDKAEYRTYLITPTNDRYGTSDMAFYKGLLYVYEHSFDAAARHLEAVGSTNAREIIERCPQLPECVPSEDWDYVPPGAP